MYGQRCEERGCSVLALVIVGAFVAGCAPSATLEPSTRGSQERVRTLSSREDGSEGSFVVTHRSSAPGEIVDVHVPTDVGVANVIAAMEMNKHVAILSWVNNVPSLMIDGKVSVHLAEDTKTKLKENFSPNAEPTWNALLASKEVPFKMVVAELDRFRDRLQTLATVARDMGNYLPQAMRSDNDNIRTIALDIAGALLASKEVPFKMVVAELGGIVGSVRLTDKGRKLLSARGTIDVSVPPTTP